MEMEQVHSAYLPWSAQQEQLAYYYGNTASRLISSNIIYNYPRNHYKVKKMEKQLVNGGESKVI